ncbi:hypothetical protein D9M73_270400 [compost metagenome]
MKSDASLKRVLDGVPHRTFGQVRQLGIMSSFNLVDQRLSVGTDIGCKRVLKAFPLQIPVGQKRADGPELSQKPGRFFYLQLKGK